MLRAPYIRKIERRYNTINLVRKHLFRPLGTEKEDGATCYGAAPMDWMSRKRERNATPACFITRHRPTATTQQQAGRRQELKQVGLHADAPRKKKRYSSNGGGEAEEAPQTFGGRAGFGGSCAARIPNPPIPTPTRPRRQISRPLPGARSDQRRPAIRGRGDLAEAWAGPGWSGLVGAVEPWRRRRRRPPPPRRRARIISRPGRSG